MKRKCLLAAVLFGVFSALSVTSVYAGWIEEEGYWWYQNADGSYACNGSQVINGVLYSFDASGHWIEENNETAALDHTYEREIYRKEFESYSSETKDIIYVTMADVTHDGIEELIWVQLFDTYPPYVYVDTVEQGKHKNLCWGSYRSRFEFFLCQKDNQSYILKKTNGIYQGEGDLSYELYSLNGDGTEQVVDSYTVHIVDGSSSADEKYRLFRQKAAVYENGAEMILSYDKTGLKPVKEFFR